jgi:LysM repeat protein
LTAQNRRQHPRATFDWPLTIVRDGETIFGRIVNISRGGALIRIPAELHPKEQFRMVIEIPEYDDVISVKGVVIRTSPDKTAEGQPSFVSGIMFTEITKEDLRYFTGNLAPEWHKDYREPWHPSPSPAESLRREQVASPSRPVSPARSTVTANRRQNSPWRPIAIGLGALSIVALIFALQKTPVTEYDTERIAALEERLHLLETQKVPDDRDDSLIRELNEQITALRSQLASFRENSRQTSIEPGQAVVHSLLPAEPLDTPPPTASAEPPPVQPPASPPVPATSTTPAPVITLIKPAESKIHIQPQITLEEKPAANLYHVVQNGQNLYRIGLTYQLSVEELLNLNDLKPGDAIYPGQRLLISKAAEQPQ